MAKGAASTAGEDICTAVEVVGRVFTTDDDDGEKAAVTPSSAAARERRETFIFLLSSSSLSILLLQQQHPERDREQCYWAEDDLRQSKFG